MPVGFTFIFSLVQAFTEFLPVSSSGHLLFLKGLLKREDIPLFFDIVVHAGSLTAILFYYVKPIADTLKNAWIERRNRAGEKPHIRLVFHLVLSTAVTAMIYAIAKTPIETSFETPSVLPVTFAITSAILFLTARTEKKADRPIFNLPIWIPLIVGLFQGLAILPGVSRSGSTIASLLYFRIRRTEAAMYSFFLAIPAILGALVVKIAEAGNTAFFIQNRGILAVSFVVSSIFSYFALRLLVLVLKKGRFWVFGFYTLAMALAAWMCFGPK